MTNKDIKMIDKALDMSCCQWYEIDKMAEEADTQEAKDRLSSIATRKYHEEEFRGGML